MTHYRRQLIQIISFFLIVESVTISLLIIVPKNKFLLIAIAISILIVVARSLWNMSPYHIAYIDYDENVLFIPNKKRTISINLSQIDQTNWQYKYCRQDKKVSFLDLWKMINAGLFIQTENSKYSLTSRITKEDYLYLVENNKAPIASLNFKKETILISKGENTFKINNKEIIVTGSIDSIFFNNIMSEQGLFKKKESNKLPFSWFGGSFRIDKQEIYYEFIRPFEFIN
jgi:hypothetical protein